MFFFALLGYVSCGLLLLLTSLSICFTVLLGPWGQVLGTLTLKVLNKCCFKNGELARWELVLGTLPERNG